ncbi:MAG: class I SAM-dependent methyltransferase [Patulibacter minatonensis]
MPHDHADTIRSSFEQQASAFESEQYIGALVRNAEWIFAQLEPSADALALDVAAGTGHAARGLARHVRAVVAVDATPAMLALGRRAAAAEGVRNVVFMEGDAYALPFLGASFDVVVCRFALHHVEHPERAVSEMLRCLRPGGQLVVADLVADADPVVAAAQNELELLRDPSHARCLSSAELTALVEAAGGVDARAQLHAAARPLAPWLDQTDTTPVARHAIIGALDRELGGGAPTGLHPQRRGSDLWFEQRFAAVTARRPE